MRRSVIVCLSPLLYPLQRKAGNTVVLIDVLRSTTVLATALDNGAPYVRPVADIEAARAYRAQGLLVAGERDSAKLPGFDFGNSPAEFTAGRIAGRPLAITTTNGTQALALADAGEPVLAGAMVNRSALVRALAAASGDVALLCSGWKMAPNVEDTLLAGQVARELLAAGGFDPADDSVALALQLAAAADDFVASGRGGWVDFALSRSPRLAAKRRMLAADLDACLSQADTTGTVPALRDGVFVATRP